MFPALFDFSPQAQKSPSQVCHPSANKAAPTDSTRKWRGSDDTFTSDITEGIASLAVVTGGSGTSITSFHGNPLENLPVEIIAKIFVAIMELSGVQWTSHNLRQLASVCSAWREIILATPQLWAFITSKNMMGTHLRLSKHYPLDIQILSYRGGFCKPEDMRPLLIRAERWRSLELAHDIELINGVKSALANPLPNLERLELRHLVSHDTPAMPAVVLAEAPKLHTMHLQDVFIIPALPLQFRSLKTFSLSSFGGNITMPIMQGLLAALSACPALEHLTFKDSSPDPSDDSHQGIIAILAIPTPVLSNLKRLVLQEVRSECVDVLLQYVTAENLTYFEYRQVGRMADTNPIRPVHSHLPNPILPILARHVLRGVTIEISHALVNLRVGDNVDVLFEHWESAVEDIRLLGMGLQLSKIDVTLKLGSLIPDLLDAISSIPPQVLNIRTIYVYLQEVDELESIFKVISAPESPDQPLPFPTLERLVIVTGTSLDVQTRRLLKDIKAFLQARNQAVTTSSSLGARRLVVDWNEDMVFDESSGVLVLKARKQVMNSAARSYRAGQRQKVPQAHRKVAHVR